MLLAFCGCCQVDSTSRKAPVQGLAPTGRSVSTTSAPWHSFPEHPQRAGCCVGLWGTGRVPALKECHPYLPVIVLRGTLPALTHWKELDKAWSLPWLSSWLPGAKAASASTLGLARGPFWKGLLTVAVRTTRDACLAPLSGLENDTVEQSPAGSLHTPEREAGIQQGL